MTKTYPIGTRIGDIKNFDRSTKVEFCCIRHIEQGIWRSKDPFASNWFPANSQAMDFSDRTFLNNAQWCDCPTGSWVTTSEYVS